MPMLKKNMFTTIIRKPLQLQSIKLNHIICFNLSTKLSHEEDNYIPDYKHFKLTNLHPLKPKTFIGTKEEEQKAADHMGRQQNHIWSKEELEVAMSTLYRHQPKKLSDKIVNYVMYGLYHTFNFVTGYRAVNPSVKAIEWRLIVLESIAGVPGFVAAGFRHFHSLRTLSRDYGWIPTLLEEAENERMHLLICIKMAKAGYITRSIVIAAQLVMTPLLMSVYLIHPKSMHRFVGYLEETACHTYVNVIKHIETPGTLLHKGWAHLDAPPIAIGYYRLPSDAKWVDALKCMMADETHHRDVNHTFADMKGDDPNPFLEMHKENAYKAWRLEVKGEPAWEDKK
eukprot:gene20592-26700_t